MKSPVDDWVSGGRVAMGGERPDAGLRAADPRYRLIAESAQEGIWAIDSAGCTLFANEAMAGLLGVSLQQLYALGDRGDRGDHVPSEDRDEAPPGASADGDLHAATTAAQRARTQPRIPFTPMAMPLLAGPGAIGVMVGLGAHRRTWEDYAGYVLAILLIAVTVLVCLDLSHTIFKRLGPNGIGVLNRIFGFIILAIAVALVARGVLALTG